ncbi:UNVERIFIED_CONTAM: Ataxin-10 [Siphonaria sp. JEL0065]|nr:Ataxin-10 [Siphonaria sp. JEL0065]
MVNELDEFETENEALRLCSSLEAIVNQAATSQPADWVPLAATVRDIARIVCREELLRKKLGIIPALFPIVSRLLAGLKSSIVEIYTVEKVNFYGDDFGRCGYSSWKSANGATDLTTAVFHMVRNLCAAIPENQILACQSGSYKTLDDILSHLALWLQRNQRNTCPDIKAIAYTSVQMGIQCLANMMTSNPIVQNKIWPRFFSESELLLTLFETNDPKTNKYVLLCVYNCIFNDTQRSSLIIHSPFGRRLLYKILTQVDHEPSPEQSQQQPTPPPEEDNFDIVYAIFKTLTTSLPPCHVFKSLCLLDKETTRNTTTIHLNILNRAHLVFLKLVDGDMAAQNTGTLLWGDGYAKTVVKLVVVLVTSLERFSNAVEAVSTNTPSASGVEPIEGVGSDLEGLVLLLAYFGRVLGGHEISLEAAITAARESDAPSTITTDEAMKLRRKLMVDQGLIESIVKLLVVSGKISPPLIGGIGKTNNVQQPKIQEINESTDRVLQVVRKGLYMMKGDSIKVISNVSFKCKEGQDEARRVGGIPVVLSHCIIDESNPFVKEWAMFAIRNLCEGNAENQRLIESMEAVGLPEGQNEGLAAYGVRAGLRDDGRIRITPVDAE